MRDNDELTKLHNKLAGQMVKMIVKPTLNAGGEFSDVLVLLESVVLGVMLTGVHMDCFDDEEVILDELMAAVTKRMKEHLRGRLQ